MKQPISKFYYLYRATRKKGRHFEPYQVFPWHNDVSEWRKNNTDAEYIGPFSMPHFPTFADAMTCKINKIKIWLWKRKYKL